MSVLCKPVDWPLLHWGTLRGTLMSLGWQEHDESFITKDGYFSVFVEDDRWVLAQEMDFEHLVERGKGETREELCELLMTLGLMPEPQAYSADDEGDRKYHEIAEGA